ncbi:MAG TPA: Fe-S-containing protein [Bacteroidota bacterium]|nr:Fe-S-containing protein [Bacteroidota bacterium]
MRPVSSLLLAIVIGLVGFFIYHFVDNLPGGAHPVIARQPTLATSFIPSAGHYDQIGVVATILGDDVMIPLSVVEEKKIVGFEYSDGTVSVPLLAFISSEGKLVTSFRLCEPCNSKKFSIDGDRLSCGNCETQWSLRTLEGLQGNCQKYPPDPLPSRIENGMIVIRIADIRNWNTRL